MKVHTESRMTNGNLKIVNNTQTSADNVEMGKTPFNLVQSAIIKRPIGVFSIFRNGRYLTKGICFIID
jgi:hypothetical protein